MKKYLFVIFVVGLLITISACTATPQTEVNPVDTAPIDLENLPQSIDVSTAAALTNNEDVVFIDVREQWEYDEKHIPGITLIPMSEVENRLDEIPTDKTVILTCRSGNRSGKMHAFLEEQGFDNTVNMEGGIIAWEAAGLAVDK